MFDKLLSKMTGGIKEDLQEEMQFLQMEAMEKLLPLAKKFAPKIEKEAKAFIEKNNCIVVIKSEKNGDLSCSILNKDLVLVTAKDGVEINSATDLFVKNKEDGKIMKFSLDEIISLFTSGALESMSDIVKQVKQ